MPVKSGANRLAVSQAQAGIAEEEAVVVSLEEIVGADNLAEYIPEGELGTIGEDAILEYEIDKASMKSWTERMKRGLDLATLVKEDKSYPFKKAANVKYPLITTAALQFNAKAYPAIVAADAIVKTKVYGSDPQGLKAAKGERVSAHMSWQLSNDIEEWEEETDKLLTVLPLVGSTFRKVWRDVARKKTRCRNVIPGNFVINDRVNTLGDAPRCTEILPLYPTEIKERRLSGQFRDIEYVEVEGQDKDAPQEFIEQHRTIDLDQDGYAEPYIVTVHTKSRKVARVVADFEMADVTYAPGPPMPPTIDWATGQIVPEQPTQGPVTAIRRGSYFVHYIFLPSLDGGLLGTGLGLLLGDISETINTIINMMVDAGHMASRGGGFIGSEFRIKGGSQQFQPGEWKLANAKGADIKSSIVPITFPGADETLFQLLGLLIEAGKEVASIKDVMTGDTGGRTMPVGTTLALIEQGMAQFTAAYKRIFRSLRCEFKLIAKINAGSVTAEEYNAFHDTVEMVPGPPGPDGQPGPPVQQPVWHDPREDYDLTGMDLMPVADPSSVTKMQEMGKAQFLLEMGEKGMLNPQAGVQRVLEAASIRDVEELIPQPDPMQQAMQQLQVELLAAQKDKEIALGQLAQAQAEALQFQAPAEMAKADAAARKAEADGMKAEAEGRTAQIGAAAEERGLMVEMAKAEMDQEKGREEIAVKWDEQERKWVETRTKSAQAAAQIENLNAQADAAPARSEAEIGKIKADTKAALRPAPKPAPRK